MSMFPISLPGIGTALKLIPRTLFIMDTQTTMDFVPGGRIIDGSAARDPDNSIKSSELRPGLILGVVNSSANTTATTPTVGLYGASVMGTLTTAIVANSSTTALVTTLACATEVVRRIGSAGTVVLTGAPTATGVVAATALTFSAVTLGAVYGTLTITSTQVAKVVGAWIGAYDGTATPVSILAGDVFPISAVDAAGANQLVPWRLVPITTKPYYTTNIINYPPAANTTQIAFLKSSLRTAVPGATFDDDLP